MTADPKKPNIILILADDMGFSDLGCTGSEIRTPNIDDLANRGRLFTSMYNCARCCPTRASMLTGLYPHKAGIGHMVGDYQSPAYQGYLRNDAVTIAEVLRPAGYRTLMSGKWHVGGPYKPREADLWTPGEVGNPTPRQRGFDRFFGTLDGSGSYVYPHYIGEDDTRVELDYSDFYITDAVTDRAIGMIDDSVEDDTPFFLYLAYTAPHWPLQAPPEDIARYRGSYLSGWDHIRTARHETMRSLGTLRHDWALSPLDPDRNYPWEDEKNRDWEDARMATYAAMVDRMDQGIGRVMARLKALGIADDTLVMFLSDNGGCAEFLAEDGWVDDYPDLSPGGQMRSGNIPGIDPGPGTTFQSYEGNWSSVSNAPFRKHKIWVHEGGISTPFIACWPNGIKKHETVHEAAHVVDILPTIMEVTGASYPSDYDGHAIQDFDGESLVPMFERADYQRQQPIFWEHEGNCAFRIGEWKLVREFGRDWELYNMDEDRTELTDLRHRNEKRSRDLIRKYQDWADKMGVIDWQILQAHPAMNWTQEEKNA